MLGPATGAAVTAVKQVLLRALVLHQRHSCDTLRVALDLLGLCLNLVPYRTLAR